MLSIKINTVLSVDDNTVLSVSLSHQQDAPPRQGIESQLFNTDGVTSPALVGDRKFNQTGGAKWCTNAVRPQPKGNAAVVMLP